MCPERIGLLDVGYLLFQETFGSCYTLKIHDTDRFFAILNIKIKNENVHLKIKNIINVFNLISK